MGHSLPKPAERTVIVALDHALAAGQIPPLDQPQQLLGQLLASAPDGLIVTYGMNKLLPAHYPGQRWLTVDYYATSPLPGATGEFELQDRIWSASDAKAAGVTGLKALLVFGRHSPEVHMQNVRYVASLVAEARALRLPVMIEPVLWGAHIATEKQNNAEMVAHAARIAFELGADVIKMPIPDNPATLVTLTQSLPIPLVLMGGPATNPTQLFQLIQEAVQAGVAGVALGRNIWQYPQPAAMVLALKRLVHEGATAKEALEFLETGGQA